MITGKPEKEIDFELVDRKLIAGCTGVEIAAVLGVHPDTLYIRTQDTFGMTFSAYAQQKRSHGDSNLREVQYNKALEGDNTMLVWLGKNRLKQSDSPQEISVSGESLTKFTDLMNQLSSLQAARKSDENNIMADKKS